MKRTIKYMRVVLIKDVPNLGEIGETKEVKPGYARNFLIEKNLAVPINDPRSQELLREQKAKKDDERSQKDKVSSELAGLELKKLVFEVKVNKKGLPFKAISSKEIAAQLKIPASWVKIKPIKEIGEHQVLVQSPDSKVQVIVVLNSEK